jgi:hypothetical protein
MQKYICDICNLSNYDKEGVKVSDFGYHSIIGNYGTCDNEECKKIARSKTRDDIYDELDNEDFSLSNIEDMIGDGDIMDFL